MRIPERKEYDYMEIEIFEKRVNQCETLECLENQHKNVRHAVPSEQRNVFIELLN